MLLVGICGQAEDERARVLAEAAASDQDKAIRMKISTRARYALRLMIDLANEQDVHAPIALRDVAERQQISKRYLEQLATSLKNANLVKTLQGRGGGYALARPAEEIRISEIIEASIGRIEVVHCVTGQDRCERAPECPSRCMWVQVNDRINEVFDSVTLADLRENGGEPARPCGNP